ncbi:MAG TPA: ABC transporter ATP-binding protein, partial [Gemmatimonadaceae bacterium]|nr:ABC transporter ATP-binding protein [Gemmatimonadaceae bacterium]
EVDRGQVKVIIGPSGSGKSTLLRCLAMLDAPDGGDVYLESEQLTALSEKNLAPHRSEVGMVFQRFNLFQNMTALGNVMCGLVEVRKLPKRDARQRALEFLDRVGLADKASQYPDELSGGQQQRVAIARALVTQPRLLLADEPTGNLDSRTTVEVMALFQELNEQGITVVLVTHEPEVAQYAKRIVEVRDGHILRDHAVTDRRHAADDLRDLEALTPDAASELEAA